jgi:hypothetical protein
MNELADDLGPFRENISYSCVANLFWLWQIDSITFSKIKVASFSIIRFSLPCLMQY